MNDIKDKHNSFNKKANFSDSILQNKDYVHSDLIEQYKLLVTNYNESQKRRIELNNFYIVIFASLTGIYNFLDHSISSSRDISYTLFIAAFAAGFSWVGTIFKGIKSENTKQNLIREIEDLLPVRVFSDELTPHTESNKLFHPAIYELTIPVFMLLVMAFNFYSFIVCK